MGAPRMKANKAEGGFMNQQGLSEHLINRPAGIREAKEKGVKAIGYFPGGYVPEEMIYASGAIPICLIDGSSARAAEAGLTLVPRIICPFARGQVGERLLKTNEQYVALDMLVAPITCQHLKKAAEILEYYGNIKIVKLGVPHQYDGDIELEYYTGRIGFFKERLQEFTGVEITDERLRDANRPLQQNEGTPDGHQPFAPGALSALDRGRFH